MLWQPTTLIWVVLGGEGLAALFALVPNDGQGRWIQFGLASFMIQWVLLLTLGGLYLLRERLRAVRPLLIACLAITFLVLSTWIACAAAWIVLGGEWGMSRDAWGGMVARFTAITLTVGLLGLAVFHNHWRTRQLAVRAKQAELEALRSVDDAALVVAIGVRRVTTSGRLMLASVRRRRAAGGPGGHR